MPGAVLFGGEQEAPHRHEVFGLVAEVDDDHILVGLLAGQDGTLSLACQQEDIGLIASPIDSRGVDVMNLHLVEGLDTRADVVLMMRQHQLMALGKHLMCQIEEGLFVRREWSHVLGCYIRFVGCKYTQYLPLEQIKWTKGS